MPVQFNWSIVGHEKIQQYLQQSLLTQKVGQFYVFAGPRDIGKKSLARKFAQSLLCEKNELAKTEKVVLPCGQCRHCRDFASGRYADYYFLNREINAKTEKRKTQISVEQVRNLIDKINMSSFSTKDYPKIVIIDEAESLSAEAANSLLKTLEEPNGRIVIFLLVENKDLLLPTILSRAQVLRFSTIDQDKIYENLLERENISRDLAKEVAGFSGGRYVTAMEYLQNPQSFSEQKEKISQAFSLLTQTNARKFQKIE
ncbi:MAG: AAA family ATPase, partial [Patescibacteria group bacterium]